MSAPVRIQRLRAKGWRAPADAIYVGRPTIWGNPFVADDPALAVEAYRRHCRSGTQTFTIEPGGLQFARNAHRDALHHAFPEYVAMFIGRLRGHDLMCWCRLDQPCHADVLLELANG